MKTPTGISAKGKDPEDRAHVIADGLIGTCLSIHAEVSDEELDDIQLMSELDEIIFECEGCGWWCSTDELNNGGARNLCNDCEEEAEEPEDD